MSLVDKLHEQMNAGKLKIEDIYDILGLCYEKRVWVFCYTKNEPEEISGGEFSDGKDLSRFMDFYEDPECWNNWNSMAIKPNRELCRFMVIDQDTFKKEIGDIHTTDIELKKWLRTHQKEEMSYQEAFKKLQSMVAGQTN